MSDDRQRLSYLELWQQAESVAIGLHSDYGVRRRRKVAIACRDHSAAIKSIFAASRLGAHVFLVNPGMSPDQLTALDQRMQFDFWVYDDEIDAVFFPSLNSADKWLAELERILPARVLQQTDRQALKALLECWATKKCVADAERVERILEILRSHNPGSVKMQLMHYDYMRTLGVPSAERIAFLEKAVATLPRVPRLHKSLIREYLAAENPGGVYESVARLMRADSQRWQMPAYKALFTAPAGGEQ